jgi:hypothetical protein
MMDGNPSSPVENFHCIHQSIRDILIRDVAVDVKHVNNDFEGALLFGKTWGKGPGYGHV